MTRAFVVDKNNHCVIIGVGRFRILGGGGGGVGGGGQRFRIWAWGQGGGANSQQAHDV